MQDEEHRKDDEFDHQAVLQSSVEILIGVEHQAAAKRIRSLIVARSMILDLQGERGDVSKDARRDNQARCIKVVSFGVGQRHQCYLCWRPFARWLTIVSLLALVNERCRDRQRKKVEEEEGSEKRKMNQVVAARVCKDRHDCGIEIALAILLGWV